MKYGIWAYNKNSNEADGHWSYADVIEEMDSSKNRKDYRDIDNRFITSDVNIAYRYCAFMRPIWKELNFEVREK